MRRSWAALALAAACGNPTVQPVKIPPPTSPAAVSPHACEEPTCTIEYGPTVTPRATPSAASRSRPVTVAPSQNAVVESAPVTGSHRLSVTAYCWTGARTASGVYPEVGMAAGNRWPFGTRLRVEDVGVVVVTDRIGHGSQLDLYLGRDGCEQRARAFGRRSLRVEVIGRG